MISGGTNMKRHPNYYNELIKTLKDPREAAAYLSAALEDGDKKAFLLALRNVLEAHGGMTKIARESKIHRVSLYKMFSAHGNPELESLLAVFDTIGIKLEVVPKRKAA